LGSHEHGHFFDFFYEYFYLKSHVFATYSLTDKLFLHFSVYYKVLQPYPD